MKSTNFTNVQCFDYKTDLEKIKPGFYKVKNPLHVFKRGYTEAGNVVIINLVIPTGAVIRTEARRLFTDKIYSKMRASEAYVHSIVRCEVMMMDGIRKTKNHKQLKHAASWRTSSFKYTVGKMVYPKFPFSFEDRTCDSGIHFFMNSQSAINFYG